MADIFHDFPINAQPNEVFRAVTNPDGLDQWWTMRSAGAPGVGTEYELFFGPEHDWRATVTASEPNRCFELEIVRADADWVGTRVGFELESTKRGTRVRFHHAGWAEPSQHYRISSYCWAMYLRILKRYLEHGEEVAYEKRLDV